MTGDNHNNHNNYLNPAPDHLFVSYETNSFRSELCTFHDDLGIVNGGGGDSSTDIQKAYCFDTPSEGKMARIRIFARSETTATVGGIGSASIPKCCHDPYPEDDGSSSSSVVVEYIYQIRCTPSCEDPDIYHEDNDDDNDEDNDNDEDEDDNEDEDDDTPTSFPTQSPSMLIEAPTGFPTHAPSDLEEDDDECPSSASASSHFLSRDLVTSKQINGPHWGSRHGWAWPGADNNGCSRYASVDDTGAGAYAWPCSVATRMVNNRVLGFDSEYLRFRFYFDQGMTAQLSLADSAAATTATTSSSSSSESVTMVPSGGGTSSSSSSSSCSTPPESAWNDYPIRLVKSGRYHHHWYASNVDCNGDSDDTRIEIKVTPDCVELHMVSNTGAKTMNWLDGTGGTPLSSSTNGYAAVSYCVRCDSEVGVGGNSNNAEEELSGCSIVETPLPTDCCPLNVAGPRDSDLCGTGWNYETCPASSLTTTEMTSDVTLSTVPSYPVTADGHSFHVAVPRGSGNQLTNDAFTAVVQNNASGGNHQQWKKVKVNFHIQQPRRVTGVSGVLVDPETGQPTGIHVQMSKNWHQNRPVLYDSYWWTGIAHIRVPPGETKLKLVIAYQYYEGLHGVSHSQLSLLGWATNGLWEEVGLGSNGEAITYEPHGHHRRQTILDTRPWLVCQMGQSGCQGSPDNTQWTENVGGGDFLNAVDKLGRYQYLVGDTAYHTMNGPRLTNATYAGISVDSNMAVSRTVSTWTADDFVRHLHSFRYDFLNDVEGDNYPRFAMYTLGGDNYNYVRYPLFAYGSGNENAFLGETNDAGATVAVSDLIDGVSDFTYTDYYSVDAPIGCSNNNDNNSNSCWFAMLTNPDENIHQRGHRGIIVRNFHGRLNGATWPPSGEAVSPFTFNLIKSRNNNAAKNTVSIELGLPSEFKAAVALGQAEFKEGDYLEADIELLVPPRQTADYFGDSQRLRAWLTEAGVDENYGEGWKVIAKEASEGDDIVTTVFDGALERKYHPRVKVECNNEARFNIAIPEGMPGILPITIAGVRDGDMDSPLGKPSQQLWRYDSDEWKPFATGAAYQLEKDVLDHSYTFVYSLSLEFSNQSSGSPANACEQFFFGDEPPSDTNPSC